MRYLFPMILAALLLSACGKKGPLIPPEAMISTPVNDLRAIQRGDGTQLSWTVPDRDEGGRPVRDLAGFLLMRREVLPPEEDCETCPDAYKVIREVDLEFPRNSRLVGNRVYCRDKEAEVGRSYQYKVVSYLKDGTASHDSNKVRIIRTPPLPSPVLRAESTPTSILLHWERSESLPGGGLLGYNIYRRRSGALPSAVPLNNTPIKGYDFEDFRLERGIVYIYAVRAVAEESGVTVESSSSNEEAVTLTEPD